MLYCKDCKFCKPNNGLVSFFGLQDYYRYRFARCLMAPRINERPKHLVSVGDAALCFVHPKYNKKEVTISYNFCGLERQRGKCGPQAKNFVPKEK